MTKDLMPDPAEEFLDVQKPFIWNQERNKACVLLGMGYTMQETADHEDVSKSIRTIARWKKHPEFAEALDKCSLMYGLASSAERLRLISRAARQFVREDDSIDTTGNTFLDFIKQARIEKEGTEVKLNIVSELESELEPGNSKTGSLDATRSTGSYEPSEEEEQ